MACVGCEEDGPAIAVVVLPPRGVFRKDWSKDGDIFCPFKAVLQTTFGNNSNFS